MEGLKQNVWLALMARKLDIAPALKAVRFMLRLKSVFWFLYESHDHKVESSGNNLIVFYVAPFSLINDLKE